MFDNKLQNPNNYKSDGVFNQFIAPITTDNLRIKKDPVRNILLIFFVVVIILAIGSVFLSKSLEANIETKQTELNNLATSQNVIQFKNNLPKMRNLSQQLKLLSDVYNSKQFISSMFFPVLGSLTESTRVSYVYFNRVSLKKDNQTNLVKVNLSGVALDYPTLYRQVNNFKYGPDSSYIHDFKLQNFSMNKDQHVEFSLSFDIEVNTTAYAKYLKGDDLNTASTTDNSISISSGPLFDRSNNNATVEDESMSTSSNDNVDFNNSSSSTTE